MTPLAQYLVSDPDELEQISIYKANGLVQWFDDNLLVFNSGKTKLINFCHRRDCKLNWWFSLHLGETEVHPIESIRFLGLDLDRNLNIHSHNEQVS